MRFGILIAGMLLFILTYVIVSSPSVQVQVVLAIGTVCSSVFGTAGFASWISGCQNYLFSKFVFYSIGILLILFGILLPGKPKPVAKDSRAGGKMWDEASPAEPAEKSVDKNALKVLKMRYAKGEITKEQYDQMLADLRNDSPHHSANNIPY
jgi:uncharacterized membrane protein